MQIPLSGCQTPGGEEGVPGAQGVHVLRAAWALGGAGIGPDVSRQPRAVGALRNVDDEGFMQGHEQGTEKEREMAWAVRAGAGVLAQEAKRTVFQLGRHPSQICALQIPAVFCSWLRSSSLEANYPEVLVQPAGCFFHFLPLTGQSPGVCVMGEGRRRAGRWCQDCSRQILYV